MHPTTLFAFSEGVERSRMLIRAPKQKKFQTRIGRSIAHDAVTGRRGAGDTPSNGSIANSRTLVLPGLSSDFESY